MEDIQIDTLGYYVDRTFTHMVKFLNYELSAAGLDIQHSQFAILMVLSKKNGISLSQINKYINRDKASLSRNIKFLEDKGYIRRDFEGGKKKNIFLTERGNNILPIIYEISQKDTDKTLKGFSESKRKAIYEILYKMYLNISTSIGN